MKRPEIDWTAVTTVLTGIGVVAVLGPLQFSLSESADRRISDMRSDIRAIRVEIGELRKEVAGEIKLMPWYGSPEPPRMLFVEHLHQMTNSWLMSQLPSPLLQGV